MDNETFEILEKKIDQLIQVSLKLKKENQDLKAKNQELVSSVAEKERKIQQLVQEAGRSQSMQSEIAEYKDKQGRIRNKVENLLEKLQEFEKLE